MKIFDFFKKKKTTNKIKIFGQEVEVNTEAMIFSQKALESYYKQNFSAAVEYFTKAINAQPSNQNFHSMRGVAYEDMGNDIKAGEDFVKALELEPTSYIAAYRLGMVFYRKQDLGNAVKWLKTSYDNCNLKTDKNLNFNEIYGGNNNLIVVNPKIISSNLGSFLVQLGRVEESFKYIDKAIELDENYHFAYLTKALAYLQMGQPEKGIPFARKAKELGNSSGAELLQTLEKMRSNRETSTKNPLNIQDDPRLSNIHKMPNFESVFHSELLSYYVIIMSMHKGGYNEIKEFTEIYAVSMLISYYDNAKITPMCIVDTIAQQLFNVCQNLCKKFVDKPIHSSADELKSIMLKLSYNNSVKRDVRSYLQPYEREAHIIKNID